MLPSGNYVFDFGDIFEGPLTRAGKGEDYKRTHPQGRFYTNYNLLYRLAQRFQSGEAQGVAEWLKRFDQVNAEDFWSLVWYDAKLKPVPIETIRLALLSRPRCFLLAQRLVQGGDRLCL